MRVERTNGDGVLEVYSASEKTCLVVAFQTFMGMRMPQQHAVDAVETRLVQFRLGYSRALLFNLVSRLFALSVYLGFKAV